MTQEEMLKTAKDEMLTKAGAFEEMTRTNGWKWIEEYIGNKVADFTNRAIGQGFKDMNEYNAYRGEIVGLQNLLAEVTVTLQHLKKFNEESKSTSTE